MSALDDVLGRMKGLDDDDGESTDEARAELELLREEAFERARDILKQGQTGMTQYVPERVTSILRTDPERAKRMGLGWAL